MGIRRKSQQRQNGSLTKKDKIYNQYRTQYLLTVNNISGADLNADPDPSFHFDADPDPVPRQSDENLVNIWYTEPPMLHFEPHCLRSDRLRPFIVPF
jgi:hypothetical protein